MRVLKFGGTSVGSAERIRNVVDLVEAAVQRAGQGSIAVVCSAMGGITDQLVRLPDVTGDPEEVERLVGEIERCHLEALQELALESERVALDAELRHILRELRRILRGIGLLGETSPRSRDRILATGELLSVPLVAAALRARGLEAVACDARELVRTDGHFGSARVLWPQTEAAIRAHFERTTAISVLTGFIAADDQGETTTLGRGGSDYTAALVGAALDAEAIEIWTDVNGVLTADPRQVPEARSLEQLSYDELMELAHFGAKVVFPPTIQPARRRGIPLIIRNSFRADLEGTRVAPNLSGSVAGPTSGISSLGPLTLLRLEGPGMIGVPGIAARLFAALAGGGISVVLVSQASSEHSICLAIAPELVEAARELVHREFELERREGAVDDLIAEEEVSVVAVVGDGMREHPGIAAKVFGALGEHDINVRAIAQGSSERNISLVVARSDESRSVRAIHDVFFGHQRSPPVVVLGCGGIGTELLRQLRTLGGERPLGLHVAAVCNSSRLVGDLETVAELPNDGAEGAAWLQQHGRPYERDELAERFLGRPAILVDCTAAGTGELYRSALAGGGAVVSANKIPFCGSQEFWDEITGNERVLYAATVGAGLPALATLRALVGSGDHVEAIDGGLSGTLAFLLSELRSGASVQTAIRSAFDQGLSEPDPREDLRGMDVARKLLILARTTGARLELESVEVAGLLPGTPAGSLEDFWAWLAAVEDPLAPRLLQAGRRGNTLAYLGVWAAQRASAGLVEVAVDHPAGRVQGTDNFILLRTRRYPNGLLVQGAGAGVEVTAGSLVMDVQRAQRLLTASLAMGRGSRA